MFSPMNDAHHGSAFHLLYVDNWDAEQQEATGGGRTIGLYASPEEALAAYDAFRVAAPLMWGEGHLALTNEYHELVYAPTLLPPSEYAKVALGMARN